MADKESKPYLELWKELDNQFLSWKDQYKEITDYVLPRRGKYIDDGQTAEGGEKRHSQIYDGTATRAIRMGASGFHGSLTSPARPWFRFTPPDIGMMKTSSVRGWLQFIEKLFYTIYARSNFYQCIHTIYEEEFGFGTGDILQEEDPEKLVRFYVLTAGEYRLATNQFGIVDTNARLFYMTARQMAQKFGEDALGKHVRGVLKKKPNEYFKILQLVRPNKDRDVSKEDSPNLPVQSIYLEYEGDQEILERKGYHEMPHACPRWSVIGNEPYGVSPTMDLLGDIKMLQVMTKDFLLALHKVNDPPMRVPSTYKDRLNMLPGGLNWVDPTSDEGVKPLYQINPDLQSTQAKITDVRQQIREGYYNDLFLMLSQSPGIQPKNMMEIMELQEEKLIMLGPVIERQFHELLDPVISRTFSIAWRQGLIPMPPPELEGADLKVEYVSFLAQAQKRIGTSAISSTVAFVGSLAAFNPEAIDKIDVDEAVDAYAEMVGPPTQMIRDAKATAVIRDGRAQAMAQQQEMAQAEAMATAAKGVKQLAGADMKGDNALTALVNGGAQQ
jgi:hypothetical protein